MSVCGGWYPLDLYQEMGNLHLLYLQSYGKVPTFAASKWLKTMAR